MTKTMHASLNRPSSLTPWQLVEVRDQGSSGSPSVAPDLPNEPLTFHRKKWWGLGALVVASAIAGTAGFHLRVASDLVRGPATITESTATSHASVGSTPPRPATSLLADANAPRPARSAESSAVAVGIGPQGLVDSSGQSIALSRQPIAGSAGTPISGPPVFAIIAGLSQVRVPSAMAQLTAVNMDALAAAIPALGIVTP